MDLYNIIVNEFSEYPPEVSTVIARQIADNLTSFPPEEIELSLPTIITEVKKQLNNEIQQQKRNALRQIESNLGLEQDDHLLDNLIDNNPLSLPPQIMSLFTNNLCNKGRVINTLDNYQRIDDELFFDLWRYFRLTNRTALDQYPSIDHIKVSMDLLNNRDNMLLYRTLEPVFLQYINTDLGSIVLVTNNSLFFMVKNGDNFEAFKAQKALDLSAIVGINVGNGFGILVIECDNQ